MNRIATIIALSVFLGFLGLAVFGMLIPAQGGESLSACVARTAGIVSCVAGDHAASSWSHEALSFQAVTSALIAAFVLVIVSTVFIFARVLELSVPAPAPAIFSYVSEAPSVIRLRRWLSLLESSPGR